MNKLAKFALGASIKSFFALLMLTAAAHFVQGENSSLPTLRGDEAIEQLQQNGQYDSLMEAFNNARRENGQRDDVGANSNQNSADINRVLGSSWIQEARRAATDGAAGDNFGWSIAISGNTAIVGVWLGDVNANTNQGSAYIFVRSGTAWSQQAKLVASNGAAGDQFGFGVAISGDTAIVGARLKTVGSTLAQGSAYIFVRSGTSWSQEQEIIASDGSMLDSFGISVGIDGDTVIVGAWFDDIAAGNQGSAYIFTRSGTTWSQQAKLFASDGAADDNFGWSVAVSGDTAIAGVYRDAIGSNAGQGSAYVFTRSGTTWSLQQKLTASDGAADDSFGYSVGVSGNTAIVGAYLDDAGASLNNGSAYIFVRSGASWSQQQKLTAADSEQGDLFGNSVGISGDTVVIGAVSDDTITTSEQGSAYVFTRSGTVWSQQAKLFASDGADGDNFGKSVAISGDKIVAGANLSDSAVSTPLTDGDSLVPQAADQGGAYFFALVPTAASASISGRVFAANGHGLRNAIVYLTDAGGNTRMTRTSAFGYYRFDEIEVGQTVIVSVSSKRFQFAPQIVTVNDELTNLDFIAQ